MGQTLIGAALRRSNGAYRVAESRSAEGHGVIRAEQSPRLHYRNSYNALLKRNTMGRIEQVESAGMNAYNRILTSSVRTEGIRDYRWGEYDTAGFIEGRMYTSDGSRPPKTAEEIKKEIIARFGEGDYIYATCRTKRRSGQFLVMRLLEKKVE